MAKSSNLVFHGVNARKGARMGGWAGGWASGRMGVSGRWATLGILAVICICQEYVRWMMQRMPSPLEICACIVAEDACQTEHGFQSSHSLYLRKTIFLNMDLDGKLFRPS